MANVARQSALSRIVWPLATAVGGLAVALVLGGSGAFRGDGWAFVKLGLALAIMVGLLREKAAIGLALLVGAVFIGTAFQVPALRVGHAFTFGVFDAAAKDLHGFGVEMVRLMLMVFLINLLGQLLMISGGLRTLVEAMGRLFRDVRWVMAGVPAVIGLLPMPGGAVLSAPIVGEVGDKLRIDDVQKTAANFWFRHVWEWWWPLYPAILIMVEQKYASMTDVLLYQGPFTVLAILLGWYFVLRKIRFQRPDAGEGKLGRDLAKVAGVLWPVVFVVLAILVVRLPKPYGDWVLPAALVVADAALIVERRIRRADVLKAVRLAASWQMMFLIFGVCVLKGVFHLSGAATKLPAALAAVHVPAAAVCFLAPFAVNVTVGYNLAGVTMTFPLLVGLFQQLGPAGVAVAYGGAYLGMMSSPVHLCLALTREYYRTEWGRAYRALAPMLLIEAAGVALLGWLGRW